jgi:hypothetical protein
LMAILKKSHASAGDSSTTSHAGVAS